MLTSQPLEDSEVYLQPPHEVIMGADGSNSPSKRQSKGSLEEETPSSGMN